MSQSKNDSLFSRVFDGPDSLFGRIFGSETEEATEAELPPASVRITLGQKQFDRLERGEVLKYKADGQTIELVAPAKYPREYVERMLHDRHITQAEAEIMLRMRA